MSSRPRLSLDGQWYFSPTKILNTDHCPLLPVPSPWQVDAHFRDYIGEAWYQREFELPTEWFSSGRVIFLGFGAVDYFAEVWLNDIKVGEHEGGYLPFELDVTEAARPGVNTLTVRVDDPLEIFAEIPHGKQSWYGMLSGIWQPVWVESRPEVHVERVRINTNLNAVNIVVTLSRPLPADHMLDIQIVDPTGAIAAQLETASLDCQLLITNPQTWSPDEPNLYTLRINLTGLPSKLVEQNEKGRDLSGLEILDGLTETFGVRTIEARDGKILLNGRPFYLRAALDQDYYPDLICTPPSPEYIEAEFRKAKEMGLNCLRAHIKVPDPRYYAAADKIGLLIWTELPNHILLSDDAKRRARATLAGMLERDGNHPSIGIWTIINESWGIDLTDAAQRAWLVETYQWLKELDPTRLVVDNSACLGNFHVATDIADFHNYYAMPDHYAEWRDWTENYARRPGWLFAHEYKDHQAWREFIHDPWDAVERPLAAEAHPRGHEPLLVSEFGNWGLPDVTKLYEGNQGTVPWWFDTGLEWGDGVVYPRGLEGRFKDYHLDRVFPSLSALSESSQHLQYEALKYEIEQIRRYESIQGYVITELTDVHWECNGLLDMVCNSKVYHHLLKYINADDVLIPLWDRLVFSAGATCEMKILFSHYSPTEIREAVLEWELIGDPFPRVHRGLSFGPCPNYAVTELGTVSFDIPEVEKPTKARLRLRLLGNENLIASTEQEFYLFPSLPFQGKERGVYSPQFQGILQPMGNTMVDDLSEAELAVTAVLDDSLREFLLRGGKVLFLAEESNALQTYLPGFEIQPRVGTPWQGDWASSFGWHRFASLPTDNLVNFAFVDLTPEHVIYGFAPRDFASDVYAGLFVGWLHKPIPTIARRRVGRGELLVSTFRLAKNVATNGLARYLFTELMRLLEGA